MVTISKRNKRQSLHNKYKVAKKVRQHKRKERKLLKNKKAKKELPIEMQIPMEVPFKDRILNDLKQTKLMEIEAEKNRIKSVKALQKKKKAKERQQIKRNVVMKDSNESMAQLIEQSDVIVFVLDARDPMGSRSEKFEQKVREANKSFIFALNKIDLVSLDNAKKWLAFLTGVAPTFAIKSSCYDQAVAPTNACKSRSNKVNTCLQSFGGEQLTQHLTSLAQGKIVVGIAGAPNCGKSALVNTLKRKRACESNRAPSLQRSIERFDLNGQICLLKSPALEVSGSQTQRALRNFLRVEAIENLAPVAQAIYERCQAGQLGYTYVLGEFADVNDFLLALAAVSKLKKGGVPVLRAAHLRLVNDWNNGKLSHCTEPPKGTAALEMSADEEATLSKITCQINQAFPTMTVLPSQSLDEIVDPIANDNRSDEEIESKEDSDVDMDQ